MRVTRSVGGVGLGLVAALAFACGGGGGGGDERAGTFEAAVGEEDQVVVEYDHDQDGDLDVLTLDPSQDPFVIVEALESDASGAFFDRTALLKGRPIDSALSEGLQAFLEEEIGDDTILLIDSAGNEVPVQVLN